MVSLARLLDSLQVVVEPLQTGNGSSERLRTLGAAGPTLLYRRRGIGMLELAGGATVRCSRHSIIIMPPSLHATPRETLERPDVVMAGCRIRVTYHGVVDVFDQLPEPLVETFGRNDPARRAFEALVDELAALRPGWQAMTEALLRRCLILVLRRHCEHARGPLSWLAALAAVDDAQLGRAVSVMQGRPERSHTLLELAELAGMSRSLFASRFADVLGQSPIEFLKTLRLTRAAELLGRTDLPVKSVAARVGYASRSSFTRAFAARYGVGPTAFRAPPAYEEPHRKVA